MELEDFFTSACSGAHDPHLVSQFVAIDQVGGETDTMGSHGITTTIVVIGHLYVVIVGLVGEEGKGGRGELSKNERNDCGEVVALPREIGGNGGRERGVMTEIT
jgi:hypothetical protein